MSAGSATAWCTCATVPRPEQTAAAPHAGMRATAPGPHGRPNRPPSRFRLKWPTKEDLEERLPVCPPGSEHGGGELLQDVKEPVGVGASHLEALPLTLRPAVPVGQTTALKHRMGHGGERLLAWYAGGDTEYRLPGTDMVSGSWRRPPSSSARRAKRLGRWCLVEGPSTSPWVGGKHPLDVPVFVVSSSVPPAWVYEGSPFTFVTDGLESALEQAQAVAGDKDVGVGAASIVQQCIRAGLLEEIHLDLVPVLLGGGVSLFDHLGTGPIDLERTRVIEGAGGTHLTFRVVK